MRVLMIVMSPVAIDARVAREAQTLSSAGWEVDVVGLETPLPPPSQPVGVNYHSVQAGPGLHRVPAGRLRDVRLVAPLAAAARWALLPHHRRARTRAFLARAAAAVEGPYDVVHAHDFPTLGLAHELALRWNARVVYDAHEWWTGRRREERPTPVEDLGTRRRERHLGGRADAVLTVSDAIAEQMRRRYGWTHVTLVRNTFPMSPHVEPSSAPNGLLYAGRIAAGRDLATVIAAAPTLGRIAVSLMGPVDHRFVQRLDVSAVQLLPAVPVDAVDAALRGHGLALVSLEDGWPNHRMALPNKLFQAVRAGVPVVASELPELARMVRKYGLGTLYGTGSPRSLAEAVAAAVEHYGELAANVARARAMFDWRTDGERLVRVYEGFALRQQERSRR